MEHQYCLFYKNDKLQFGWIREVRKNKLVVVPEQGKEFNCASSRVEYIWKGKIISTEKEALEYLSEKAQWSRDESLVIELDVIYELCEPGTAYSLDELAENFLEDFENGWLRTALLIRLKSDNKLFQQRKSAFYARSVEEIALIENQDLKKREAEEKQEIETKWALSLLDNILPTITESQKEHWQQFIHRFRNFIIHLEKSQEKDYFCTIFQCQLKDTEKVERKLLDCFALSDPSLTWGKLVLERSSVDFTYKEDEIRASEELLEREIHDSLFQCPTRDQKELITFTVDHDDTLDYDDALSWEETEEGISVRVHITDVASLVSDSSILFERASERFSSLYTIKEIYPMFAPVLSEGMFSLKETETRAVLTFEFNCDSDGNILNTALYRSIVSVAKNLSYEEVDSAISNEESFWPRLWEFCEKQAEVRRNHGSLEFDRYEVKLDISDPANITLKSIRQNTPASLMIQELAILTNHLAASYAQQNNLPCLFRNQPPYSITKELGENEKPTLKDINIQPARVSLNPEGHSALGLDCYLQVTSPIRRFLDLVNQTLILSHLGGQEVSFSTDSLLEWARRGEEIQREFNLIERKLLDHWKIKYLEQHRDELFDAQFVRIGRNGKTQINIVQLQLILEISAEGIPEEGTFKVTIDSINSGINRVVVRKTGSSGSDDLDLTDSQEPAS